MRDRTQGQNVFLQQAAYQDIYAQGCGGDFSGTWCSSDWRFVNGFWCRCGSGHGFGWSWLRHRLWGWSCHFWLRNRCCIHNRGSFCWSLGNYWCHFGWRGVNNFGHDASSTGGVYFTRREAEK